MFKTAADVDALVRSTLISFVEEVLENGNRRHTLRLVSQKVWADGTFGLRFFDTRIQDARAVRLFGTPDLV